MANIELRTVLQDTAQQTLPLSRHIFVIKDYQRGYRWGKQEIETLLKDIYSFYSDQFLLRRFGGHLAPKYCLQPIVVKKLGADEARGESLCRELGQEPDEKDKVWELIDGQQRLTTLLLILNECYSARRNKTPLPYDIIYVNKRKIDRDYIEKAKRIIHEWFEHRFPEEGLRDDEMDKVRQAIHTDVQVIWYEVDPDANSNAIFTKLNMGKIPLTNAELFKALLLSRYGQANADDEQTFTRIAFEWDAIERSLHEEEFWYFICNKPQSAETGIDYLLELYVRALGKNGSDRWQSFYTVRDQIDSAIEAEPDPQKKSEAKLAACKKIWEEIVLLHDKLREWYRDHELYHQIGFLIAASSDEFPCNTIVTLLKETSGMTKSRENSIIKGKVKERFKGVVLEKLDYDRSKTDREHIRDALLYFNLYTMIRSEAKARFSFRQYKKKRGWDIEHVYARAADEEYDKIGKDEKAELLRGLKSQIELIESVKGAPDANDDLTEIDRYLSDGTDWSNFAKFYNEILAHYDSYNGNGIGNLVLLDAETNRSYKNALFAYKRRVIMERDCGEVFSGERVSSLSGTFIPVCTKNVFLKMYSGKEGLSDPFRWTASDAESYLKAMQRAFEEAGIL